MSGRDTPEEPAVGTPDGAGLPDAPTPGDADDGRPSGDGRGPLAAWRRTYGASPLHLLLHLAAIVLIAWALSQSFDARYEAAYENLAIWMVGGAVLNDFVALPLYLGVDRVARTAWSPIGGTRTRARRAPVIRGNGHVRVPVAMAAVLLLVYFPNITHKAPIGHRLSTGLADQPDWAARWLAITAGLLLASAALYGLRVLRHRARGGGAPAPADVCGDRGTLPGDRSSAAAPAAGAPTPTKDAP